MTAVHRACEPHELKPGEYCFFGDVLYACTPNGLLANCRKHIVSVADGILSVQPSIDVRGGSFSWHGWIVRGEWREA